MTQSCNLLTEKSTSIFAAYREVTQLMADFVEHPSQVKQDRIESLLLQLPQMKDAFRADYIEEIKNLFTRMYFPTAYQSFAEMSNHRQHIPEPITAFTVDDDFLVNYEGDPERLMEKYVPTFIKKVLGKIIHRHTQGTYPHLRYVTDFENRVYDQPLVFPELTGINSFRPEQTTSRAGALHFPKLKTFDQITAHVEDFQAPELEYGNNLQVYSSNDIILPTVWKCGLLHLACKDKMVDLPSLTHLHKKGQFICAELYANQLSTVEDEGLYTTAHKVHLNSLESTPHLTCASASEIIAPKLKFVYKSLDIMSLHSLAEFKAGFQSLVFVGDNISTSSEEIRDFLEEQKQQKKLTGALDGPRIDFYSRPKRSP
ncbi:MAG TPA: hypothetical protein VD999_00255 [Vitreimonas sp.]|nr:hypothetical protein [Vitreimonas sp.]